MILTTFLVLLQHRLNTRLPYRFGGRHLTGHLWSQHTILMFHLIALYKDHRSSNLTSRSFDHLVWRIYRLILLWLCRSLLPKQDRLLPHQPFHYRVSSHDVMRRSLICASLHRSRFLSCPGGDRTREQNSGGGKEHAWREQKNWGEVGRGEREGVGDGD